MLAQPDDAYAVVNEFLNRFYHEEPSDDVATTSALKYFRERRAERWELAKAFRSVLERQWQPNQLRDFVRREANRFARSDDEAHEFLQRVYEENLLDVAFEPD